MTDGKLNGWCHPKRILVATNLIDGPSLMLFAVHQAKLTRAEILLVHVIRPSQFRPDRDSYRPFVLPAPPLRSAQAALDQLSEMFDREGILCEPILLKGDPAEQISLLAKDRGVDRVLVASGIHCGIERLLTGSLAEDLARSLDVPVCIVGHRALYQGSMAQAHPRILVATSFRRGSALCAKFGAEFVKAHSGSMTLLHVMETRPVDPAECRRTRRNAFQKLRNSLDETDASLHSTTFEVRGGNPAAEIVEASRFPQHELIILGSPAESLVTRILGSSVIHQVLAEANCPVMVVKPRASVTAHETPQASEAEQVSIQ